MKDQVSSALTRARQLKKRFDRTRSPDDEARLVVCLDEVFEYLQAEFGVRWSYDKHIIKFNERQTKDTSQRPNR